MSLQDVFYVTAIIFMTLITALLIGTLLLLIYIKQKIQETTSAIEHIVAEVRNVVAHPREIAADVGSAFATKAIERAKEVVRKGLDFRDQQTQHATP